MQKQIELIYSHKNLKGLKTKYWKRNILSVIVVFISGLLVLTCQQNHIENSKDTRSDSLQKAKSILTSTKIDSSDFSHLKLTLTRGAFHWDSFELKGNELTYIPSKSDYLEDYPEYQNESMVRLSDGAVIALINDLMDNGIFEMDSLYENLTTCNSMIEVEFLFIDSKIKIKCSDYQKGCPEILTQLEDRLIKLHGKGLKRIVLPG
ncbi:hypothetical protein GCM10009117_13220 [Gangjinia marincola]|uniref:Uncharacterized protein n=1 Tax=Gangjinia marincola TaxID=578463 RepID=A0ABP3XUW2_9FLAO